MGTPSSAQRFRDVDLLDLGRAAVDRLDTRIRIDPRDRASRHVAEATVELMRYSKNLRRFPRFGLDMIPSLLAQVRCWSLKRNDDLAGAADLLIELVA